MMRILMQGAHEGKVELQQVVDEAYAEVRLNLGLGDSEELDERGRELVVITASNKYWLREAARPVNLLRLALFFAFTVVSAVYSTWLTVRGELEWTYLLPMLGMPVVSGSLLLFALKSPLLLMLWGAEVKERSLERRLDEDRVRYKQLFPDEDWDRFSDPLDMAEYAAEVLGKSSKEAHQRLTTSIETLVQQRDEALKRAARKKPGAKRAANAKQAREEYHRQREYGRPDGKNLRPSQESVADGLGVSLDVISRLVRDGDLEWPPK